MWNRIYYSVTTRQCRQGYVLTRRRTALCLFVVVILVVAIQKTPTTGKDEDGEAKKMQADLPLSSPRSKSEGEGIIEAEATSVSCGGHHASTCAECPQGHGSSWCNGDCKWESGTCQGRPAEPSFVHPAYRKLIREYPFQPVRTQRSRQFVNIILVRSPFRSNKERRLYEKYKKEILFLGISSFEAFPLSSPNPFSANFSNKEYVSLFPGWLHMMRNPEEHFPPEVKTLLLSQSDFALEEITHYLDGEPKTKKYDFTYSGTDQDVANDCVGWASFAKNWTFVKRALEIMCGDEFNLTGVLVATKDKQNVRACTVPKSCNGKMIQTTFLEQGEFLRYTKQSKFAFLPQVYDASPRASTQALALDVPLLMNRNILGGWKYINDQTGEFFNDMSDFKSSLRRILDKWQTYQPKRYVMEHLGDEKSGIKLKEFVMEHWADRVRLPPGTRLLIPTGA